MRIIPAFALFVVGILTGLVYLSYGAAKPDGETSAKPTSLAGPADVDVPDEVRATIRAKAAEDHQDNYSTQTFLIKNQLKAYRGLRDFSQPADIPDHVFYAIVQNAAEDHPHNYSTQLFLIKNVVKAYRELESHRKQDASRQRTLAGEGSKEPLDTLTPEGLDENACRFHLAWVADYCLGKAQSQRSARVNYLLRTEPSEPDNRELARLLARHIHRRAKKAQPGAP
jgi:hypothetical protein